VSSREPGKHPYARAYDQAAGERSDDRDFVPPFRTPIAPQPAATDDEPDAIAPGEDPDTPRRPPADHQHGYGISRAALVLVALAMGLGLLIGRVSVNTDDAPVQEPIAAKTTPATVPLGPTSLQETGARCSQQRGPNLVLGVEVRNVTTGPVRLKQLRVNLPPAGLTLVATGVGACGELNVPRLSEFGLPTQGTVWLSATLRVTVKCPAALPVSETIYAADNTGRLQPIKVAGFANLKQVPWSRCPAPATSATKPGG